MHAMLLDMSHNAPSTVIGNLYGILVESAMRCVHYISALSKTKRPAPALLLGKNDWLRRHLTVSIMHCVVSALYMRLQILTQGLLV